MAKFVVVDQAPRELKNDECVITAPQFLEEIRQSNAKASGKRMTSLHHLRQIVTLIGSKYDPENFNPYSSIPLVRFEGIPFTNDEDLSTVILRMFNKHYPEMLERAIEYQIKNRKSGTKTIYFVGSQEDTNIFFRHGIPQAESGDND